MAILPFLITGFNGAGVKRAQNDVVRDLASLKDAINNANENVETTILVDSFEVSNATMMDAMRNLNINGKTIVIKGVGEGTTITTMDQGSFYIVGEKGKVNNVTFENITFKQNIDKSKTISLPNNAISLSKTLMTLISALRTASSLTGLALRIRVARFKWLSLMQKSIRLT